MAVDWAIVTYLDDSTLFGIITIYDCSIRHARAEYCGLISEIVSIRRAE